MSEPSSCHTVISLGKVQSVMKLANQIPVTYVQDLEQMLKEARMKA